MSLTLNSFKPYSKSKNSKDRMVKTI